MKTNSNDAPASDDHFTESTAPERAGSTSSAPSGRQPPSESSGKSKRPSWAAQGQRIDKPNIDDWANWERLPTLDGVMMWQGDNANQDGVVTRLFIVRDNETGMMVGFSERSNMRDLRRVPRGSKVWINYTGRRETGRIIEGQKQTVMDFEIVAEKLLATDPTAERGSGAPF